jgi:hypothetical protein
MDDPGLWAELTATAIEHGAADDAAVLAARAVRWLDHHLDALPGALVGPGPGTDDRARTRAALDGVLARWTAAPVAT